MAWRSILMIRILQLKVRNKELYTYICILFLSEISTMQISQTIRYYFYCCYYYDTLIWLNQSVLESWLLLLDVLLLIIIFKNKTSLLIHFDAISLYVPTGPIRDFSTFDVSCHTMDNFSTRCIPEKNVVCRHTDCLNREFISLTDIKSMNNICNNIYCFCS
jgi:hypothetical protein